MKVSEMKGVVLVVFLLILQAPFSSERPVLGEVDGVKFDEGGLVVEENHFGIPSKYSTEGTFEGEETNRRSGESDTGVESSVEEPDFGFGIALPRTTGEKASPPGEVQSEDESSDVNNTTKIESARPSRTGEKPSTSESVEALLELAPIEPKTFDNSTESLPPSLLPTNEDESRIIMSITTESNFPSMTNSSRFEKIPKEDSVSDLLANMLAEGSGIGSTTLEPTNNLFDEFKNSAPEEDTARVNVVPGTAAPIEQSLKVLPSLFDPLLIETALGTKSTTPQSAAMISSIDIEFNPEMVGFKRNDTTVSFSQDVVPIGSLSEKSEINPSSESTSFELAILSENSTATSFDNESSTEEYRESTTNLSDISTHSINEGTTEPGASQSPLYSDGDLSALRKTEGTSQSSLEFQAEFSESINKEPSLGSSTIKTSSNPTDVSFDNVEFAGPDLNQSTNIPSQQFPPELVVPQDSDLESSTPQTLNYTSAVAKISGIDLLSTSVSEESFTTDPEFELTEPSDKVIVESFPRINETTPSNKLNDPGKIVPADLKSVSPSVDKILGQSGSLKDSADLLSLIDVPVSKPLAAKDDISSVFTPELITVDLEPESSTFESSKSILDFVTVSLTTSSTFGSYSQETTYEASSESPELEQIVKSFLAPIAATPSNLNTVLNLSVTEPSFNLSSPIAPSPIAVVANDLKNQITVGTIFLTTTENPVFETVQEPTEPPVLLFDNVNTAKTTKANTFHSDQAEDHQQSVPIDLDLIQDPIVLTSDADLFNFDNIEGSAQSNSNELEEEDAEFYDDSEFASIWNSVDSVDYNFDELEGLSDIISDYGLSKESDSDKKESQENLWAKFDGQVDDKLKSPEDAVRNVDIGPGGIDNVALLTDQSKDIGNVEGSRRRKPLVGSPILKHEDVEEFQYKSLSPDDFYVGLNGNGPIRRGKYISFDEILEVQDVPDFIPLAQKVSNFSEYNHICHKCTLTGEIAFHNDDNQFDLMRTREFLIQVDSYLQRFFEEELKYTDNYVDLGNATRFDQSVILDFNMTFTHPINESFIRSSFNSYLNEQTLADLKVIPNSSALVFQRLQINEPIVKTMGIELKSPTYRSRLWLEVSVTLLICLSFSLIVLQQRKCQTIPKELPSKSLAMIEKHINEANEFELALTNYKKSKAEEDPPKIVPEDPAEVVDELEVTMMETQMVKGFGTNGFRHVEEVRAEKQSQFAEVRSQTLESSKSQKTPTSKARYSQWVEMEIIGSSSEDGQTGEPTNSAARRQVELSVRPKQPHHHPIKPTRSSRKNEYTDSD